MTYATETHSAGLSLSARFAALRTEIADRFRRNRMYRQTFDELSAMTDRELSDIGIARSMIKAIANEAARGGK